MPPPADLALLAAVEVLARRAGEVVMAVYREAFAVEHKDDGSPVTRADEQAEAVIVAGLQALDPATPVVAEEAAAAGHLPAPRRRFWLVDPLDGTREFVARNGEFTVNIALVEDGAPVLGVVLAPALGRCYAGLAGQGAWCEDESRRRPLQVRLPPAAGLTVAQSRSHRDAGRTAVLLARWPVAERIDAGSALKFGLVAAGRADLYPRLGRTMEWDTAAGQCVLEAAGGRVLTLDGQRLAYGKPGYANPDFLAWGGSASALRG